MARTSIQLPDHFIYRTELAVRVSEINYAGHLSHVAVLSLVQEARQRFLKHHGFQELDLGGPGLIITDAQLVYRAEAHHGDLLTVELALADLRPKGFDTLYRLSQHHSQEEVARAKVGHLFFDYAARRVVEAPPRFRAAFYP